MGITRSPLPQNNGNLPLPFFVVIAQLLSWKIFLNDCICILNGSPGQYLLIVLYVILKIGGNENSPNFLYISSN